MNRNPSACCGAFIVLLIVTVGLMLPKTPDFLRIILLVLAIAFVMTMMRKPSTSI